MAIQWTGLFANTGYSSANNKTQDDAVTGMQDTLYVTGPGYGAYEAVVKLYNSTGAVVATVNVSGGGGAFSAPPPVRFVDNSTVYSYSLEVVRGYIPTEDANGIVIRLVGGASKRYPSPMSVTPSGDVQFGGAVTASNTRPNLAKNRVALFGNSIGVDSYFPTWKLIATDAANGYGPWRPSVGITAGKIAHPVGIDLRDGVIPRSFVCTTAGTTSTTEPTWPTVVGGTVTDGSVVWTAQADYAASYWKLGGWTIAQAMSGQKFDEVFMVGAAGQSSVAIMSYRDAAIDVHPNIMAYLHMFENDILTVGMTESTFQSRIDAVELAVRDDLAHGRKVILGTVLPVSTIDATSSFTGYVAALQTRMWNYANARIRAMADMDGVYLADFSESYIDPNWANPVWPDNVKTFVIGSGATQKFTIDGVHPLLAGHWQIARVLASALDSMPGETLNFVQHGVGQGVAFNPLNYGAGGTGTNVAGVISDKKAWSATVAGATASVVPRTDVVNGNLQRIVGSFAASSTLYCYADGTLTLTTDMLDIPLQGYLEVKIAANPTKLQSVVVGFSAAGKGMAAFSGDSPAVHQMIGQFLTSDITLVLKTPPVKMPPTATVVTLYPVISTSGSGAAYTIDIGRSGIRRAAT